VKVLHVLDHSLPLHSGYVFRTQGILSEQRVAGIETVHLTSIKHEVPTTSDIETIDGFEFHRTRAKRESIMDRVPGGDQLRVIWTLRRRLEAVVRATRPDIVHAHSPCLNGIAALHVARRHRLPVVYELRASWEDAAVSHGSTHEGSVRYRLSKALETYVLKRVDAITTLCAGLKGDVMSRGVADRYITVVPNAVDRNLLDEIDHPTTVPEPIAALKGRPTAGFFGSFYSYEGLDLLVDAIAAVRTAGKDLVLVLLGSGPEEAALKARVRVLGLEDRVRFVGRVRHDLVAAFYKSVDLFVFPRRRMRLTELVTPLKPLEAMAARALVLASNVGGHRELIEDGKTGLLFPPDDVPALTASLLRALEDGDGLEHVREAGRRYVNEERTWPRVASRYLPLYDSLLGGVRESREVLEARR
jgi:PEP-CTERM/exosortase A-associated glycosyltransferase